MFHLRRNSLLQRLLLSQLGKLQLAVHHNTKPSSQVTRSTTHVYTGFLGMLSMMALAESHESGLDVRSRKLNNGLYSSVPRNDTFLSCPRLVLLRFSEQSITRRTETVCVEQACGLCSTCWAGTHVAAMLWASHPSLRGHGLKQTLLTSVFRVRCSSGATCSIPLESGIHRLSTVPHD